MKTFLIILMIVAFIVGYCFRPIATIGIAMLVVIAYYAINKPIANKGA